MLRSEAVQIIQEDLQMLGADTAPIIARVQQAQALMEKEATLPWFLDAATVLSTTIGSRDVTPPTDFLREAPEAPLYYIPVNEKPARLWKDSDENLRTKYYVPGSPMGYLWRGAALEVFPEPDAVYPLAFAYSKKAAILSSDIENLWLKHAAYWLIGVAGALLAPAWRDGAGSNFFAAVGAETKRLVLEETSELRYRNRSLIMGGED